jgi:copper homeostasis protein
MTRFVVEIACDTLADVAAAAEGGADRIELCSALALEGLTPSAGTAIEVARLVRIPFVAMVRPRAGDFVYSAAELAAMERDVAMLLEAGAAGVVFGCLNPDKTIAMRTCMRLVLAAGGAPTVFHRAFDQLRDHAAGLEQLVDLGITRVLTSGGQRTALQGMDVLRLLVERAAGRIEVMAGGGVREGNVEELIRLTGVGQVHMSRRP